MASATPDEDDGRRRRVCCVAGLLHGARASDDALHSTLRQRLDAVAGGASIDSVGVVGLTNRCASAPF